MGSRPFTAYVAEAEALRRLGTERIWLDDDLGESDYPWSLVGECKPGSVSRHDLRVDVDLEAVHSCGLTFRWSVRIEPRRADGSPNPEFDAVAFRRLARLLPEQPRAQFLKHLANCVAVLRERAGEYRQYADRREASASELELIAAEVQK